MAPESRIIKPLEAGDLAVVSFGGNALTKGKGTVPEQREAARDACSVVAALIMKRIITTITHGNGKQVGDMAARTELAYSMGKLHDVPFDALGADTQGAIGYMLEQELYNQLIQNNPVAAANLVTLVTQVVVDANDPGFADPQKPIGPFMTEEQAKGHPDWDIKLLERGYRRVVPSPIPIRATNAAAIQRNALAGVPQIVGGGGGIPVVEGPDKTLKGVAAVIDKDRLTALVVRIIAEVRKVSLMAILTEAPGVMTPEEFKARGNEGRVIPVLTTNEARALISQLPKGSMGPKLEACVEAAEAGVDALIANFANGLDAILRGTAGTRIVFSKGCA